MRLVLISENMSDTINFEKILKNVLLFEDEELLEAAKCSPFIDTDSNNYISNKSNIEN